MSDTSSSNSPSAPIRTGPHALQIDAIELVGGERSVAFSVGLNIILGDITTGKTTLVRLLRAFLGTVPDLLPPEVGQVRSLRGRVTFAGGEWAVLRPLTTRRDAPVELARRDPATGELDETVRVPASGGDASYSRFVLDRLSLPSIAMPRARKDPSSGLTPVTATDWLGYCIVTGDELDSQIFGHQNQWRDQKRRWIFELVYGYYDSVTAELVADLRGIELRLNAMEHRKEIIDKFLADTPFGDRALLRQALVDRTMQLADNERWQHQLATEVTAAADASELRASVIRATAHRDRLKADAMAGRRHLQDLIDLRKQLQSQTARLTRAIVADEWLVDFDFVVCPRCGSDVDQHRAALGSCYLCLQPERPSGAPDALMAEQDRLASQIDETEHLISNWERGLASDEEQRRVSETALMTLIRDLDSRTAAFVSARADTIRRQSAQQASLQADIARLNEYLVLVDRQEATDRERVALSEQAEDLRARIEARTLAGSTADDHVRALEKRLLEYLEALHIPQLGDLLTVSIQGPAWLPTVSGRSFDELSSQGLKTLVNAAHALAQHTVAIDRDLPLPGLLVLDGLSANAGREGYDGDRVEDLYRLLARAAADYNGLLQIIAVDNELPSGVQADLADLVVLTLSQEDRLIRTATGAPSEDA